VALAHCPFQSLLLPFQAVNHALLRTIPHYFYAQITSSQQRDGCSTSWCRITSFHVRRRVDRQIMFCHPISTQVVTILSARLQRALARIKMTTELLLRRRVEMHLPRHVLASSSDSEDREGNVTCSPPFPPSQCWYFRAVSPRFSAANRSFSFSDWRTARAAIWVYLLYLFFFCNP
jgi:hypothetical protein